METGRAGVKNGKLGEKRKGRLGHERLEIIKKDNDVLICDDGVWARNLVG